MRSFHWLFVILEVYTIFTVLQLVLRHPLAGIMSSLSGYTGHIDVLTDQINLKPLVAVVRSSGPGSSFVLSCPGIESSLHSGMSIVQLGRRTHLSFKYRTTAHAERFRTFWGFQEIYENSWYLHLSSNSMVKKKNKQTNNQKKTKKATTTTNKHGLLVNHNCWRNPDPQLQTLTAIEHMQKMLVHCRRCCRRN